MIGRDPPIERIVEYLHTLSAGQQADLLVELDRKRLNGEEVPGTDPMVRELRRMVRGAKAVTPRIPSPSRLFFQPAEPFLVGHIPHRLRRGRIARASLAAIWSWIYRDVMPVEAKAYSDRAKSAVLAGDMATAEQLARNFQDRIVTMVGRARTVIGNADDVRERLVAYGGPPRARDDLLEILNVLKVRDELAEVTAALPDRLANFNRDVALRAWGTIDPLYARRRDAWFYGLLILMSRLGAPWQLIRLAIAATQSDSATRIAESPYAVTVALVLHDVEDLAGRLRIALATGWSDAADETLWDLHEAIETVSSELDFAGDPRWPRQLAGIRDGVAQLLRSEIAVVPERIALVLTPRTIVAGRHPAPPATNEVDAAAAGIAFAVALKPHAPHFGVDADVERMRVAAGAEVERAAKALLDRIRDGGEAERVNCLLQIEVAARLAGMLHGQGYLATFAGAARAAASSTGLAARRVVSA
jgi:hypothetical protein